MTGEEIKAAALALAAKWKRDALAEQYGAITGTLRECADAVIEACNGSASLTALADKWAKDAAGEKFESIADTLTRCARELRATIKGVEISTPRKKRRYVRRKQNS